MCTIWINCIGVLCAVIRISRVTTECRMIHERLCVYVCVQTPDPVYSHSAKRPEFVCSDVSLDPQTLAAVCCNKSDDIEAGCSMSLDDGGGDL